MNLLRALTELYDRIWSFLTRSGQGYWDVSCISRTLRLGKGLPLPFQRNTTNAFSKSGRCADRSRRIAVLSQSLHTHGIQHQDDFERRGRDRRGRVGSASHRAVVRHQHVQSGGLIDMGLILIVLLVLLLAGSLPTWPHSRSWGYYPSGGLGTILAIVLILMLIGRI